MKIHALDCFERNKEDFPEESTSKVIRTIFISLFQLSMMAGCLYYHTQERRGNKNDKVIATSNMFPFNKIQSLPFRVCTTTERGKKACLCSANIKILLLMCLPMKRWEGSSHLRFQHPFKIEKSLRFENQT